MASESEIITIRVAAEAVFSVWRHKPHLAKFRRSELFGRFYEEIFSNNLNAAQVAVAVRLFRIAENKRRSQAVCEQPRFLHYASHFLAMIMGKQLLQESGLSLQKLDHSNYNEILKKIQNDHAARYTQAVETPKNSPR